MDATAESSPPGSAAQHRLSAAHSPFRRSGHLSLFGFVGGRETHAGRLLAAPLPSHSHLVSSLSLHRKLKAHRGCVNTVAWHEEADSSLLISGSDDTFIHVWRAGAGGQQPRLKPTVSHLTGHSHNIFGASFVPGSSAHCAVTCGADGEVRHHDLVASHSELLLACVGAGRRENMAFKVTFLPGQRDAFVCTYQDGHVRLFDLRLRASSGCGVQKVCSLGPAVLATSLAFHPGVPSLFALGAEPDPLI